MQTAEQNEEVQHTPTRGCLEAAEYFIDWESSDGVSEEFMSDVDGCASDYDARLMIAKRIDEATGTSQLLVAAQIALEQIRRVFQTVQLTPSLDDGLCTAKDELRDAIKNAGGES